MDPFRQGCFIHIRWGQSPLCAVEAAVAYLVLRGNTPGPFFLLQTGSSLTQSLLTSWLRQILEGACIPGNFSSHTFRIGAATIAARNGIPDHVIQKLGYWTSNTYQHTVHWHPFRGFGQLFASPCVTAAGMFIWLLVVGCGAWSVLGVRGSMVSLPTYLS